MFVDLTVKMFADLAVKILVDFVRHPFSGGPKIKEKLAPEPQMPPGAISFMIGNFASDELRKLPMEPMQAHKIALWVVIVIVFLCLGSQMAMAYAIGGEITELQKHLLSNLDWGYKAGLGAILGIIGGKAAADSDARKKVKANKTD